VADPTQIQVANDGLSFGNVGLLGALGFVLVYALKEAVVLGAAWLRARLSAPTTAVGTSSGAHKAKKDPRTDRFDNRPRIEDHYFFVTVDQLLEQHVPKLRCGCDVRTKMLRDMMSVYLTTWKDFFTEFCAVEIKRDGFESKGGGLASGFSNRTAMMLLDLQNEISTRWTQRGVPVEAVTAFRKWDSKLVETLTSHSEKIAQSAFFPTNRERLVALLTQHATFLATTLLEARYVLRRMNGGLDGVMYCGREIAGIDNPHDEPDHAPDTDSDPPPDMLGGGGSKLRPKTPPSAPALTTKKNRSGEWQEPQPKKPSHSEIRLRPVKPTEDDEESNH
jgi:hypothetical protein